LGEEVGEELSDHVDVGIGLYQFLLDGFVELIDEFAVDHESSCSDHVPLLEVFEVLMATVDAEALDGFVLALALPQHSNN
jgi:hypothetical protein